MPTVTEALRKAIDDSGSTIYRIAKDSGVSFSVVSRFHRGERDVTPATADRLAEYLDLELTQKKRKK